MLLMSSKKDSDLICEIESIHLIFDRQELDKQKTEVREYNKCILQKP